MSRDTQALTLCACTFLLQNLFMFLNTLTYLSYTVRVYLIFASSFLVYILKYGVAEYC